MAARFIPAPNLEEIVEALPAISDHLDRAAERIAVGAAAGPMGSKYPGRYGPVTVERVGKGRRVTAEGPLAHLDEWGSANNAPKASMRRAAAREGRFVTETR